MFVYRFNGSPFVFSLMVALLVACVSGCGESMPQRPEADDGSALQSESPIRNVVFQDPAGESAGGGVQGTLQSFWGKDKPKPGIDGEDTMKWANETFEALKAKGMTTANDASSWVTEDFKNMNAWEYKVVETADSDAQKAEFALNNMGKDRWECFAVQPTRTGMMLFFKKHKKSYLKSLPTADLMRLVPMMRGE